MAEQVYVHNTLSSNQINFNTTILAFIQCAHGILADMQQPIKDKKGQNRSKKSQGRYVRMIDYLMTRL